MEVEVSQQEITLGTTNENKDKINLGKKIIGFFKESPDLPVTMSKQEIDKVYPRMRLQMFLSCFLAYIVFYLCRKNISAALPIMGSTLHYSNTQLGIIGTTLYITYSIGKFTNGMIADKASLRKFLPTALLISVISNLAFVISAWLITPGKVSFFGLPSASILLWLLAFFWGCNGWVQSVGFTPIARSFTFWFSNRERGRKWTLWSTSHQLGTLVSIILSGFLIKHLGWKAAFYVPAIIAVFVSIYLFSSLRDKPASIGLPDIEEYKEPETVKEISSAKECVEEKQEKYSEILRKHVLSNRNIWLLAISFIFVYFILMGTLDWLIKYLVDDKHNSLMLATQKLSAMPLFGIMGTISAGYVSDKLFKSKRAPVNIIYLLIVALAILALHFNPSGPNFIDKYFFALTHHNLASYIPFDGSGLLDFLYIGIIGFSYGPQVLIGGVCAIEAASTKKVAAAAAGFVGAFGYIGSAMSGTGIGIIVDKIGWHGAIYAWVASAVISILLLIPLCIDEYKKEKVLCS